MMGWWRRAFESLEKFRRHIRHHFERSFPDAPPTRAPPRIAQQNSRTPCPIDFKFYGPSVDGGARGSAPPERGGPRRLTTEWWGESVEGRASAPTDDGMVGRVRRREGVRADGRQNGGEGSAAVERGSVELRGSAPPGRRNGGKGPRQ
ncbi:hypothetical protein niasHT_022170 [Heterodera trifolii]|uniref:Uncharacterized protein n=1 Tax=Heterodera trifolii TaxID=157864 RepID=A0ABD2KP81_9BILA